MEEILGFPFLHRKMLKFEQGTTFDLFVQAVSEVNQQLNIRGFTKEGPFDFVIQTGAGSTNQGVALGLPDIPIALSVMADATGINLGGTYVLVQLRINQTPYINLVSGYPQLRTPLTWPNPIAPNQLQERGQIVAITGSNPAAGAEISETIPARNWWKIKLVRFVCVNDATVLNRRPRLRITVNSIVVADLPNNSVTTASQTSYYQWATGIATLNDTEGIGRVTPFPSDLILPPGTVIETVTPSLPAGDDFAAPTFLVERFLTG